MYKVTAQFPDINREVDLVCSPGSMYFGNRQLVDDEHKPLSEEALQMAVPYLGCHVQWVASLYLQPMNAHSKFVRVIKETDTETTDKLYDTLKNKYYDNGELVTLRPKETAKMQKALQAYEIDDKYRNPIFEDLVTRFKNQADTGCNNPRGPTFVVMADNINSFADEFPKCSGIANPWVARGFKVSHFIDYIVKNKLGFLMASPIGRNQFHQSHKNFSLTQAYIWIPPNHTPYVAPSTWYMSGRENLPSWDQWYKDTLAKLPDLKGSKEALDKGLFTHGIPKIRHSSHRLAIGKTATAQSLFGKKGN